MVQILFAFLGGVLTVAAPCILPVLPILLGSSVGQKNKLRPLFIILGFITTFALTSLVISIIVRYVPFFSQDHIRTIAVIFIGIFGIFLIWPLPFELLMSKFSRITNATAGVGRGQSNTSGLLLGMTLGLVWAPCAGPILATILALIALQGNTGRSLLLLAAYSLGAGIPMLIIAYGSQYISTKVRFIAQYSQRIQQIFGVLIVSLSVLMFFNKDTEIINALTAYFPQSNIEAKITNQKPMDIGLENYGPAAELTGISNWLNSNPLTIQQLKGKVVLIDFWTYSCINCIRTLPYVTSWYDTYNKDGFVVIGVHTPEFAFEKVTSNVEAATKNFGIKYPVAQDNDYGTWSAYKNQYWPAEYLIDKEGNIRYEHFGEGNYDHTENAIRTLLGLTEDTNAKTSSLGNIASPEMYFETDRLQYLAPTQSPSAKPTQYLLPIKLDLNTFALDGTWQFSGDHATLVKSSGKIKLRFSSGKVFMVASSESKPITLKIIVDGKPQPDVTVSASQLYTLFDSNDYSEHTLEIDIPGSGFDAFTFTFG
jgi:cytochrome c biogenesis protein CcdA/thiol-disulfide isomerase/thioredoxin